MVRWRVRWGGGGCGEVKPHPHPHPQQQQRVVSLVKPGSVPGNNSPQPRLMHHLPPGMKRGGVKPMVLSPSGLAAMSPNALAAMRQQLHLRQQHSMMQQQFLQSNSC